jgi:glycosyltransferase involved in cell wall biosynthesis
MALVSVGVPVYNGAKYLAATLDSLLAQSLQEFEIVISDNASTDRTAEICRSYREKDRRVHYFRNDQNIGAAPNFNRVVELAGAPLVHCGACDDLYHPRFLERCVDAFRRDAGLVLSYPRTTMIDEEGAPLLFDRERNCFLDSYGDFLMTPVPPYIGTAAGAETRFRDVLWPMGWCLPLSGVIRKDALLRTALYRSYYGADKVLLAELALQGRFVQVGEDLFGKRVHRGGTHYKSTRERAEHESKGSVGIPPQVKMLRDYVSMTLSADLSILQRLHCLVTIAGIARRGDVWRRLLVPGPDNYWGLSFAGK